MNAESLNLKTAVKVVGSNGQISLGKEFAGKQVLVEEQEPGVWLIRTAKIIPENELWLHQPKASQDLQHAVSWAHTHAAAESDPTAVLKNLEDAKKSKRKSGSARSK